MNKQKFNIFQNANCRRVVFESANCGYGPIGMKGGHTIKIRLMLATAVQIGMRTGVYIPPEIK